MPVGVGDMLRWLRPLGNLPDRQKEKVHGIIVSIDHDEDSEVPSCSIKVMELNGKTLLLPLDLLVEVGHLEVQRGGVWESVAPTIEHLD
jgi:hypothetical protein